MNIVAIIPARGGSKGIPGKNTRPLGGVPLVVRSVNAAKACELITRVVVSTDAPEIADLSRKAGADVVERPLDISGDMASSEAAILHALEHLRTAEAYVPDIIVFLQCTSPLTTGADITGTLQAMFDQQADTALAVAPFHYFLWETTQEGAAVGINHDKSIRLLRQQRTPQYRETGSVYVMKAEGFLKYRHRFFGKTALHVLPESSCWEIDEPVDLTIAAELLRHNTHNDIAASLPKNPSAIIFDFDGVFTDNRVYVGQSGDEYVLCDRSDGLGIGNLKKTGIPMLVLSTEQNPVVSARCQKLDLECLQGAQNKQEELVRWAASRQIDLSNAIYVGNDINDIGCLRTVGYPVVVQDCHPSVLTYAKVILNAVGGAGAVRMITDIFTK